MFRQLDTPISTEQYAIGFKKGNDRASRSGTEYTQ